MGGVDVTVDRTFTDSSYPDYNNGYLPPVTFTKGPQHMDGQRALIFARSRHGDNGEGSDFARSERQKKVIVAMKDKVGALGLNSLSTITNLLGDFTNNFRTNLEPFELKRLADLATGISSDNIYSFSLDPDDKLICSGLIDLATGLPAVRVPVTPVTPPSTTPSTTPSGTKSTNKSSATTSITTTTTTTTDTPPDTVLPSTAGYVVLPCAGKTIADIQQYVTNAPLLAKLKKEGALVEVQNSTGLASRARVWNDLASLGVNIKDTTFKGKTPYDQTILYDNSNGSKPHTLDYLKNNFQFTTSDVGFPSSTADFVVVIGKDAQ